MKYLIIQNQHLFALMVLITLPYAILIVGIDHKTCYSCMLDKPVWSWLLQAGGLIFLSFIIAYPSYVLYQLMLYKFEHI